MQAMAEDVAIWTMPVGSSRLGNCQRGRPYGLMCAPPLPEFVGIKGVAIGLRASLPFPFSSHGPFCGCRLVTTSSEFLLSTSG